MAALPPPVSRLLEAANAHDTGSFLAAFTDDGVVDDWGREFAGLKGIRAWSANEFIGVAVSLSVTEANVTEDEATILAEVGGSGYTAPSHFTFTLRDGLVSRMTSANKQQRHPHWGAAGWPHALTLVGKTLWGSWGRLS